MSVPARDYDPRRIFLISCPTLPFFKHKRAIGTYVAGALVRTSLHKPNPSPFITYLLSTEHISVDLYPLVRPRPRILLRCVHAFLTRKTASRYST